MQSRPKSNMHNKKNQFNTTFKNPPNQIMSDVHSKKHPNSNKPKYNNVITNKNYRPNSNQNNQIINNNNPNIIINNNNNNINQINSPYIKKSHNQNTNKKNPLEILAHQGPHNQSANLNNNKKYQSVYFWWSHWRHT